MPRICFYTNQTFTSLLLGLNKGCHSLTIPCDRISIAQALVIMKQCPNLTALRLSIPCTLQQPPSGIDLLSLLDAGRDQLNKFEIINLLPCSLDIFATFRALHPWLEELTLSGASFNSSTGLLKLAAGKAPRVDSMVKLCACSCVRKLEILELTERFEITIIQCLADMVGEQLEGLHLMNCLHLTQSLLMCNCPSLRSLYLSSAENPVLQQIGKHCQQLESLTIGRYDSSHVSDAGISHVLYYCRELTVLTMECSCRYVTVQTLRLILELRLCLKQFTTRSHVEGLGKKDVEAFRMMAREQQIFPVCLVRVV